jgi:hypothetical protein
MDYKGKGEEELDLAKDDLLRVFKRYNHWSYVSPDNSVVSVSVDADSGDRPSKKMVATVGGCLPGLLARSSLAPCHKHRALSTLSHLHLMAQRLGAAGTRNISCSLRFLP